MCGEIPKADHTYFDNHTDKYTSCEKFLLCWGTKLSTFNAVAKL